MNYRAPQKISKLTAMMQLSEVWNHTKPQGEYVGVQKNPCEMSKPTVSWHNIQIVAISSVSNLQLLTCCKAIYSACQRTRLSSRQECTKLEYKKQVALQYPTNNLDRLSDHIRYVPAGDQRRYQAKVPA